MRVIAMLPPSISKEVQALALPSFACLVCMVVPAVVDAPRFLGGISVPAYFFGTAALGALSIGHEYTNRTLSLLLSLPARREHLLAVKLSVLAISLAVLWFAASTLVFTIARAPHAERHMAALVPALCGLFLAPWLTMACRSPIAGAVFALAIPAVLLAAGELIGINVYGYGPVMQAFRLQFVWIGTLAFCGIGGAMTWRMFTRLEEIDGGSDEVRLPHWASRGSEAGSAVAQLTRRNAVWLLVTKELRLQQMPVVLAALYVLIWMIAASPTRWMTVSAYVYALGTGTIAYAGLLSLLIGSSASAAERQMGTLEWQVLLPIAAWKQWAVKVGVVLGLTLTLAIGLPNMLTALSMFVRDNAVSFNQAEAPIITVTLLATGSLYVSSLCRSGLWALLMSISAVVPSAMFLQFAWERVGMAVFHAVRQFTESSMPRYRPMYFLPPRTVGYLVIAGVIAIAMRFALINHRSADRPAKRVWMQVIVMATFVAAGIVAGAAWQAFLH